MTANNKIKVYYPDNLIRNMASIAVSEQNTQIKNAEEKKPTCIIVLGMAGSGKTTFVTKLVSRLYDTSKPYVINLDPACNELPYPANIGN